MTQPLFWHEGTAGLAPGDRAPLVGSEGHHAAVVRRLRAGERLVLTDGRGAWAESHVLAADKQGLDLLVDAVGSTPQPQPRVCVVQAIPKGERADLAVEVLTEVGADTIVPWTAERCVAVWRGERAQKSLARWRRTAAEAAKQARRTRFPAVAPMATTADVEGMLAAADLPVVLHEAGSAVVGELRVPKRGEVVVVVGPEGGLSDAEVERFSAAGAPPVRMGPSVLRTSTAGVAAVAALLAGSPRWG